MDTLEIIDKKIKENEENLNKLKERAVTLQGIRKEMEKEMKKEERKEEPQTA